MAREHVVLCRNEHHIRAYSEGSCSRDTPSNIRDG